MNTSSEAVIFIHIFKEDDNMAKAKKLPSGSWRCLVYDYTDSNGKRIYKSFTSDDPTTEGRREAELMAAEYAAKKNKQKNIKNNVTVGQAILNYCNLKNNVLSPSTIREYIRMQRNNYDSIKDIKLNDIRNDVIQEWVNIFSANHSPKSVKNAYGLLRAVIDTYKPDIKLHITLPQRVQPKLYVPSDNDIKAILDYFSENDKDMEIAVYLAAFGTLRRSEVCALTASDVHGNIISVNKAMVDKGSDEWVIKTTKTVSSTRMVEMPDFVINKLPQTGRLVNLKPDQVTHRFEKSIRKLGITQFRFHDLRHYAASIMHAIGVPDQYIMQRGGWSSDQTLKAIYRGTIEEYTQKYNSMTLQHFDTMQHEMQHKNKKPSKY